MRRRWKILLSLAALLVLIGVSVVFGSRFITPPKDAASQQKSSAPLPDHTASVMLVHGSMDAFAQALITKDYTNFFKGISARWQKQTSPEKISAAFRAFDAFGREVQQAVQSDDPVLNAPPQIDADGILVLQGFYRIEATKMLFALQYVFEDSSWKLFGINVEVK